MQDDDCEKITRLGDSRKRARSAGTGTTGAERRNVHHASVSCKFCFGFFSGFPGFPVLETLKLGTVKLA
jgi:hypothetical protein